MILLHKGQYVARLAETAEDLRQAQELRFKCFFPDKFNIGVQGLDQDAYDSLCQHVLIEHCESAKVVCCFRLMHLENGRNIDQSYSAQYYELGKLRNLDSPVIEMGRFCIDPEHHDPDILRIAWAATTLYVDQAGASLLFGCSSFKGMRTEKYSDAFALLKERYLAPKNWMPKVKSQKVFRFAQHLRKKPDMKQAMKVMPPLLKSYLLMGGWVSNHAVVDPKMNTLHVFTGLEVKAISASRKRLLRSIATQG